MVIRGEFFGLRLNARREGDQLVSIASFRMAGRRREYQLKVRLPAGGRWCKDEMQVVLPARWGDTATRARFIEEVASFARAATGPDSGSLATADARERQIRSRVPFELE